MDRDLLDKLLAEARELEKEAKQIRDTVGTMQRRAEKRGVTEAGSGQPLFKPSGWKVNDDIKRILDEHGGQIRRGELEEILVKEKLAGDAGSQDNTRLRAARTAITTGKNYGYLVEDEIEPPPHPENIIRFGPEEWINPALQQK